MMRGHDSAPNSSVTAGDYSGLEPLPYSALEPVPVPPKEHYRPAVWVEPSAPASRPAEPKQRILGLSVRAFWTIVIILVVVGAGAIGGGVGGGLAARNSASSSTSTQAPLSTGSSANSQSSTTTPTSTTNPTSTTTTQTAATGATSPAPTDEGCPTINGTAYTPTGANGRALPLNSSGDGPAQSFQRLCETNWPAGPSYGNPGVHDILKVYMPSLEACITACAEWNANLERNIAEGIGAVDGKRGLCRAVVVVKAAGEYCYLKNSTGKVDTFGNPKGFSGAVLIS